MQLLQSVLRYHFRQIHLLFVFILGIGIAPVIPMQAMAQTVEKGPSGLMVPRFQSLRSDEVNVRRGPGKDHKILWVFRRIGMPVEIISEYKDWYEIRDSEGAKGWVHSRLLSRRKTVLISGTPSAKPEDAQKVKLLSAPSSLSEPVAFLVAGVVANLISCDEDWCQISAKGYGGWIKRNRIWGIHPWRDINDDNLSSDPKTTATP